MAHRAGDLKKEPVRAILGSMGPLAGHQGTLCRLTGFLKKFIMN
ncbi:hypothetical protein X474_26975 [Dethiosulfatarculus sandiegensis]|uniref:Uncharacterized protein n=1 Tax=Dethiosulfatarculus sandiegensis TaxID=1429043 RepID=A0A0D2IYD1_9BACT|nr:hypothetical protein X474_26975 [Dethiosulfatarculus sandiegensis]